MTGLCVQFVDECFIRARISLCHHKSSLTIKRENFAYRRSLFWPLSLSKAVVVSVSALPLMQKLKTKMQWHQSRQKVLAENVANADIPGFKPHDLKEPDFKTPGPTGGSLSLMATSPGHMGGGAGQGGYDPKDASRFETTPSGNSVNLEDEMMKTSQNQSDYALAATLYQKSLGMLRTAAGRGR
jgi:flagellar basal-body rod protein FlgB